ncbi:MAG: hypothetical protein LCH82_00055 [Actinobacteria bacterium]|nr:hypothetical protein [Actinomycetota bacterium]
MAAAVVALEALALVGLAAGYAVGIAEETESSLSRTLASIGLFLVGATILALMARAWLRGQEWQRMATLVLNALLVPVAFSVIRGNGALVGVPVLLLAVTGVTAALLAGSSTPD